MVDISLYDKLHGVREVELSAEVLSEAPVTVKNTSSLPRVSKKELEAAFVACSIVKTGLTKFTEIIMSGEPILECDDKKILEYYQNFTDGLGNRGNNLHWDEYLTRVFLDQFIYGEAFGENIFSKAGKPQRIIDLDIVDAKSINYAKKGEHVALDKYGIPVGYVQDVPYGQANGSKFKPPENITIQGNQKWIPRDRITHFSLYNFGNGLRPIGLIESAYNDIKYFLNLKNAYGEKALTVLFPKYVIKCGDEKHLPTAQITKDLIDKMKEGQYKTEIAIPYYNDIKPLEVKHPEALLNFLEFFMDQTLISLGLPKPIATGLGEETNRSTLNVQTYIMLLTTKNIIKKTTRTIERQIFKPIADAEKFKTYPKINWNFEKIEGAIKGSLEGGGFGQKEPDAE